jgi:hypothetical protein
LLQLSREKTVEKEVRNDQVVASGGVPFERIGVMQANAPGELRPGAANSVGENPQHGTAGVNDIHGEVRVRHQQTSQETSIPVSQEQRVTRAGQMRQLRVAATLEPGAKGQVFQPSIATGDAIEVDGSLAQGILTSTLHWRV